MGHCMHGAANVLTGLSVRVSVGEGVVSVFRVVGGGGCILYTCLGGCGVVLAKRLFGCKRLQ